MKKRTIIGTAAALASLLGAAAAGPVQAQTTTVAATTTTTTTIPPRGNADLVIWADETRATVLKPFADKFAAANGIKVAVQQLNFPDIRDQLKVAGPAGQGPDIIVGAHDWLGELATSGLVAPIDLGAKAKQLSTVGVRAMTYNSKVYGVPYAIENIALLRNTALVPKAPATFAELERTALALKKSGKATVALAVQNAPRADPYHMYPLYSALGGYVFKADKTGTYDPKMLGLDTPAGLRAAQQFAKWVASGLIDPNVSYDVMIQSFGEGKAPFAITGPWAVSDKERGFKVKGVKYVVEPIPPVVSGIKPAVFVGVQGFMVSAFSKQQLLAKTFLLEEMAGTSAQLELFKAGGRPPANLTAFKQVQNDPDVKGFGLAGQNGQPLPAIPAMGSVWDAWTDAYVLIWTKQGAATQAFRDAATKIRGLIATGGK